MRNIHLPRYSVGIVTVTAFFCVVSACVPPAVLPPIGIPMPGKVQFSASGAVAVARSEQPAALDGGVPLVTTAGAGVMLGKHIDLHIDLSGFVQVRGSVQTGFGRVTGFVGGGATGGLLILLDRYFKSSRFASVGSGWDGQVKTLQAQLDVQVTRTHYTSGFTSRYDGWAFASTLALGGVGAKRGAAGAFVSLISLRDASDSPFISVVLVGLRASLNTF